MHHKREWLVSRICIHFKIFFFKGFGAPRDVVKESKVKSENLAEITDEAKIASLKGSIWLQSGTNKFASQKGMTGMGTPRDVNYRPMGTGGAGDVPEEKARLTDGKGARN